MLIGFCLGDCCWLLFSLSSSDSHSPHPCAQAVIAHDRLCACILDLVVDPHPDIRSLANMCLDIIMVRSALLRFLLLCCGAWSAPIPLGMRGLSLFARRAPLPCSLVVAVADHSYTL